MSTPPQVEERVSTPSPANSNDTFLDTGLGDLATRAAFLSLFIIVGFVGNCVLVATIAQSHRLKGFMLNLFILSVAIVNLINCIVNMPLILGNTITEKWDYGDFVCRFNAFTIQLGSIGMILGLMLMTTERFLSIRCPDTYSQRLTPLKTNVLIIYSWLHSFAFSLPLIFGVIPVKAFPARYLCSVDSGAPLAYLVARSVFGYLIPIIVIFGFFIYIIKVSIQEKIRERRLLSKHTYTDSAVEEPRIWSELHACKYVGVLMLLWCICEGPYMLLTSVEQYRNSDEFKKSDINIKFQYPWELDLSFTWLKLSYAIVLPIVTFFWRKEVWQKFKNCVLCHKSNLIVDASPQRKRQQQKEEARKKALSPEQTKVELNSNASFNAPVLFATPEGLHVQTVNKEGGETERHTDIEQGTDISKDTFTTKKCDVFGSQNFLDFEDGDTSDYDSEIDPFSGSNPISVHTKSSYENHSRQNSEGQTEITNSKKKSSEKVVTQSNIDTNTNSTGREKITKKKGKTKSDDIKEEAEVDQGIVIIDDKNDHDSGRGSYGENSLKNNKKKKRRCDISPADRSGQAAEDLPVDLPTDNYEQQPSETPEGKVTMENETAENISNTGSGGKKKKKGRRKRVSSESEVTETSLTEDVRRPLPALRRPAPPSLGPIKNNQEYVDKIAVAGDFGGSELTFKPPPTLPDVPQRNKSVARQISDQPATAKSNQEDNNNSSPSKTYSRSLSESAVPRSNPPGETPKPAPRKSRIKSVIEENDTSPKENDKPPKRKERKRTTSQTDSQKTLLGGSNTSTDLSDLQDLNKELANRREQLPGPKTKKTRKKPASTSNAEVKKSESCQDLLDDPSPRL